MAISSFFIVMTVALLFAVSGLLFVRNVHSNAQKKRDERKKMVKRIEALPLPKMLQALGISFSNYFYKAPAADIEKCVTDCEICTNQPQCDEKLKIPELNPEDIEFCPNKDHLSQFSRSNRINPKS